MDNVTNPKKETLIRTTALRMCSRYIQYNAHTCAQYTLCFILYGSPPLAFKMQMSFWFGSNVLVQVSVCVCVSAHTVLVSLGPQPAQIARQGLRGFGSLVFGVWPDRSK